MKKIDAILMAAGFSERFGGKNKLLVPFNGKPLAGYTLELACSMDFGKIIFVTANNETARLAAGLNVVCINNAFPERGQRESVRLGVLASDADYYMLFTCDQPLLNADTVRAIADSAAPGKIVYPVFKDSPGNPCLFSKEYRRELTELEVGQFPRIIRQRYPENCIKVPVKSQHLLFDVDTPSDLEHLLELSSTSL